MITTVLVHDGWTWVAAASSDVAITPSLKDASPFLVGLAVLLGLILRYFMKQNRNWPKIAEEQRKQFVAQLKDREAEIAYWKGEAAERRRYITRIEREKDELEQLNDSLTSQLRRLGVGNGDL